MMEMLGMLGMLVMMGCRGTGQLDSFQHWGTTCAFFGLPIPNDAKEQLNPVQGDFPRGAAAAGNLSSLSSRRY